MTRNPGKTTLMLPALLAVLVFAGACRPSAATGDTPPPAAAAASVANATNGRTDTMANYRKPSDDELKTKLSPL